MLRLLSRPSDVVPDTGWKGEQKVKVHLLRKSIPWRDERISLCGRQEAKGCRIVEFQQFIRMGIQSKCGSCDDHARVEHHWTDAIQNELLYGNNNQRPGNIVCELEAIRELVARHRGEFDSLLAATMVESALQEPTRRPRPSPSSRTSAPMTRIASIGTSRRG